MKEEKVPFDFEAFAKQAAEDLKAGKPMVGKDGIFTPLLKRLIEASLEGELDAHLDQTRKPAKNRRNGRSTKIYKVHWEALRFFLPVIVIRPLSLRL